VEARDEAERILERVRTRQVPAEEGRVLSALAEILRRQGELEAAEVAARTAQARLAALLPEQVTVTATLAAILLAQGRAAAALEVAAEAWRGYGALGVCGFSRELFLRLTRTECLHATGDTAGARAELAEARAILHARAERIPDAEYRRGFLALPEHARLLTWAGDS
jgi:cobalamin synthase